MGGVGAGGVGLGVGGVGGGDPGTGIGGLGGSPEALDAPAWESLTPGEEPVDALTVSRILRAS